MSFGISSSAKREVDHAIDGTDLDDKILASVDAATVLAGSRRVSHENTCRSSVNIRSNRAM
jgi:hypothetical protein